MLNLQQYNQDKAARALEILEQAYAYYSQPVIQIPKKSEQPVETYFEYVKAA